MVEIGSHSYSHTPYGGKDVEWQASDLEASLQIIEEVTRVVSRSFIPPQNSYDENTAAVEVEYSLSIMSAQCTWDPLVPNKTISCGNGSNVVAPNITWNGIAMLPAGAVLGDADYWQDFSGTASVEDALGWINAQIAAQGFSVLMLHPQEFATDEATCDTLDRDKMKVLLDLIAYGKDKWQFMTFQSAASYYEPSINNDSSSKDNHSTVVIIAVVVSISLVLIGVGLLYYRKSIKEKSMPCCFEKYSKSDNENDLTQLLI